MPHTIRSLPKPPPLPREENIILGIDIRLKDSEKSASAEKALFEYY
jgi:hypothetical protein